MEEFVPRCRGAGTRLGLVRIDPVDVAEAARRVNRSRQFDSQLWDGIHPKSERQLGGSIYSAMTVMKSSTGSVVSEELWLMMRDQRKGDLEQIKQKLGGCQILCVSGLA